MVPGIEHDAHGNYNRWVRLPAPVELVVVIIGGARSRQGVRFRFLSDRSIVKEAERRRHEARLLFVCYCVHGLGDGLGDGFFVIFIT